MTPAFLFLKFIFILSTVYMYMGCLYNVFVSTWEPADNVKNLSLSLSTLFLRQGSSLNLGLISSSGLAGPWALEFCLCLSPQAGLTDTHLGLHVDARDLTQVPM